MAVVFLVFPFSLLSLFFWTRRHSNILARHLIRLSPNIESTKCRISCHSGRTLVGSSSSARTRRAISDMCRPGKNDSSLFQSLYLTWVSYLGTLLCTLIPGPAPTWNKAPIWEPGDPDFPALCLACLALSCLFELVLYCLSCLSEPVLLVMEPVVILTL